MPWGAEEGLRAQQLSGCFRKRPDLGQRMAVQCGWPLTLCALSPLCRTGGGLDRAIWSRDFCFLLTITD